MNEKPRTLKPEALSREKILVVDDIPENIRVIGNLLKAEGYTVLAATSGEQALAMAMAKKPDLVLLDVQMPEMDGFEVCREFQQTEELKTIPVIFLTARVESDDVVRGLAAGAMDYVTKPFRQQELLARIHLHLELRRARESERRLISELRQALEQVKTLSGLIPICASCKKVRDDGGFWKQVERYVEEHTMAHFSHGICPDCVRRFYPDLAADVLGEGPGER